MTNWKLTISTAELRTAMNTVVDHLEATGGPYVEVSEDYYWWAQNDDDFDPESKPEITIGQTAETWGNLERERRGDREQTITYSAIWLGQILASVGRSRP